MYEFKLIAPLFLAFVGLPIAIGLLLYFVPKKLGFPKTGKYLVMAYGLLVLSFAFYNIFRDQLFTKWEARALVEEQNLKLTDEFELVKK